MYGDRLKYYFSKAYPPHGNLLFGILEKWAKKIAAIVSQRCGSHDWLVKHGNVTNHTGDVMGTSHHFATIARWWRSTLPARGTKETCNTSGYIYIILYLYQIFGYDRSHIPCFLCFLSPLLPKRSLTRSIQGGEAGHPKLTAAQALSSDSTFLPRRTGWLPWKSANKCGKPMVSRKRWTNDGFSAYVCLQEGSFVLVFSSLWTLLVSWIVEHENMKPPTRPRTNLLQIVAEHLLKLPMDF